MLLVAEAAVYWRRLAVPLLARWQDSRYNEEWRDIMRLNSLFVLIMGKSSSPCSLPVKVNLS